MVPRSVPHSLESAPVCLFLVAGHVKEVSPGRYTWPGRGTWGTERESGPCLGRARICSRQDPWHSDPGLFRHTSCRF